MSDGLRLIVDAFDWSVDVVRGLLGWPPLAPEMSKLKPVGPPIVRVPTSWKIETRRAMHAFLRVEQNGDTLFEGAVPRDGRIVVTPLMPELIRVYAKLESRHPTARHGTVTTETVLEPAPNGPAIERFAAPDKVVIGDSLACEWDAPAAQRVRLAVVDDEIADTIGPSSGQLVLHPKRAGRMRLRLTAEAEWGQTSLVRTVEVVAPRLQLTLPQGRVQIGHPGEEVCFEWRAFGAESVWMVGPESTQPQRVDAEGFLYVKLGWRPVEFQLIARGYAARPKVRFPAWLGWLEGVGRLLGFGVPERSVVLCAEPQPFASLEAGE
jgi:hypothetical protein